MSRCYNMGKGKKKRHLAKNQKLDAGRKTIVDQVGVFYGTVQIVIVIFCLS